MANAYTSDPRVVAALQPWAELVNAFGVLEQEPVLCSMSSWGIERFRRAFAGSS
jgi:hypothetical protein